MAAADLLIFSRMLIFLTADFGCVCFFGGGYVQKNLLGTHPIEAGHIEVHSTGPILCVPDGNVGLVSVEFILFPNQATIQASKPKISKKLLLQITVQLNFLRLARDFHPVLTKISHMPQNSFLAVEMVK